MALTKTKTPYEVLIRWNPESGEMVGAHVVWVTRIFENGDRISEIVEPAQAVAVAGAAGFPLADILEQVHVDALARIDTVEGEKTDMKAAADAEAARAITAETSLAKVTKELDAMKASPAA